MAAVIFVYCVSKQESDKMGTCHQIDLKGVNR